VEGLISARRLQELAIITLPLVAEKLPKPEHMIQVHGLNSDSLSGITGMLKSLKTLSTENV